MTPDWRIDVRAKLRANKEANRAKRMGRHPDRLPDDNASLAMALNKAPYNFGTDKSQMGWLVGSMKVADDEIDHDALIGRSSFVDAISTLLDVRLPDRIDELARRIARLGKLESAALEQILDLPLEELKERLAQLIRPVRKP